MTQLSESEARSVLKEAGSEAASSELYVARREEAGWAFAWRKTEKPVPFGVRTWVVADSRRFSMIGLGETVAEALARLNS